jgi:hypothetical protein
MSRSRNGVYKRPTSNNYFFRVKSGDGKWLERSSGTSNYNEAKKRKASVEREVEEGRLPNDRSAWTLQVAVVVRGAFRRTCFREPTIC